MSAPVLWPSEGANDVGLCDIVVSFLPNSGADPAESSFRGACIADVVWNATGKHTVTLTCDDTILQVVGATVTVQAKSDGSNAVWGQAYFDETALSSGIVVYTMSATSTLASPADTQRVYLHLKCKMRNVGVGYV